jgi:hypothetical protein
MPAGLRYFSRTRGRASSFRTYHRNDSNDQDIRQSPRRVGPAPDSRSSGTRRDRHRYAYVRADECFLCFVIARSALRRRLYRGPGVRGHRHRAFGRRIGDADRSIGCVVGGRSFRRAPGVYEHPEESNDAVGDRKRSLHASSHSHARNVARNNPGRTRRRRPSRGPTVADRPPAIGHPKATTVKSPRRAILSRCSSAGHRSTAFRVFFRLVERTRRLRGRGRGRGRVVAVAVAVRSHVLPAEMGYL